MPGILARTRHDVRAASRSWRKRLDQSCRGRRILTTSIGLKWVLQEPDSDLAEALARSGTELLVSGFWLNEATNVLWLQVRRKVLTPDEAREGLALLQAQPAPTPTAEMSLHDVALDIGLPVSHSTYDTLYVAFALAVGATSVVVADGPFVKAMARHPDAVVAEVLLPLGDWARAHEG